MISPSSPRPAATSVLFAFSTLLATAVLPPLAEAQEWSRFRGPNGSGIGDLNGLPDEFTSADYEWIEKLEGSGHSSPVLWGKKLFLTEALPDGETRQIACFDASTGDRLWRWKAPMEEHNLHKYNNMASASPVCDGERVYAVWGSGEKTEAVALDHDGQVVWQRSFPAFTSDHGHGASPVLIGGRLVFHTDSVKQRKSWVICLSLENGEPLWKHERITPSEDKKHTTAYNTPVSLRVGGRETVVALQTNDGWKGLDIETGKVAWAHPADYAQRSVGSIATHDGVLFASLGSGGKGKESTALRPRPDGSAEILFELGLGDGLGYVPTPLFHGDRLFLWGDGGILTCRNATTGELVYEHRVNGNFFSSPVLADGKLLCASHEGELVAVPADGPFEILGRSQLPGPVNATPAIANNRLYLRTESHLICVPGK